MTPSVTQVPMVESEAPRAWLECMQLGLAHDVAMGRSGNKWCITSAAGRIAFALPQGTIAQILEQIAGDGIVVEVILQPFGNFPKEAFTDKLLGQLAQAVQFVDINIKVVGVA